MAIAQVACPECGAKLSSKAGFTAGQRIKCPKCQEAFAVPTAKRKPVELEDDEDDDPRPVKRKKPVMLEEDDEDDEPRPAKRKRPVADDEDDDEDERPRRKKKKGKKSEGGYANSPLRFIILGVLVVVTLVMGYFLYRKLTAPPLPDIVIPARNDGE